MGDDDPIARLRAEMDQTKEGVREFAGTLRAVYTGLVGEGFDATQAFTLTVTFLSESIRRPSDSGGEE